MQFFQLRETVINKIYSLFVSKTHNRNPSIYEKLIEFMGIDEGGSNFPKDVFDPQKYRNDKSNDYKVYIAIFGILSIFRRVFTVQFYKKQIFRQYRTHNGS